MADGQPHNRPVVAWNLRETSKCRIPKCGESHRRRVHQGIANWCFDLMLDVVARKQSTVWTISGLMGGLIGMQAVQPNKHGREMPWSRAEAFEYLSFL